MATHGVMKYPIAAILLSALPAEQDTTALRLQAIIIDRSQLNTVLLVLVYMLLF